MVRRTRRTEYDPSPSPTAIPPNPPPLRASSSAVRVKISLKSGQSIAKRALTAIIPLPQGACFTVSPSVSTILLSYLHFYCCNIARRFVLLFLFCNVLGLSDADPILVVLLLLSNHVRARFVYGLASCTGSRRVRARVVYGLASCTGSLLVVCLSCSEPSSCSALACCPHLHFNNCFAHPF